MQIIILNFLLFGVPLIFLPLEFPIFELPKVIVSQVLIEFLLLIYIFRQNQLSNPRSQVFLKVILFIFVVSLVHLVLFNTPITFFGNQFRLQGVFLLWNLLAFSFLSSSINIGRDTDKIASISIVLLAIGAIFLGSPQTRRAFGTLGEPNALAATVVFLWPFLYFSPKRFLKILGPLIAFLIILISGSRSGMVAYFMQLIFLLLRQYFKLSLSQVIIICFLFLTFSYTFPFFEQRVFENRFEVWQTAVAAGLKNPLLGGGFGNGEYLLHQTAVSLKNNIQYQYVDSSHNLFLDWWIQAGIIGLGLLIFLIAKTLQNLIINQRFLEITILLGILTVLSFNPASVVSLIALWWLIGQGAARLS